MRERAVATAAGALGGGGGGTPELATAGGRNVAGIEDALLKLREALAPGRRQGGFGLTAGLPDFGLGQNELRRGWPGRGD